MLAAAQRGEFARHGFVRVPGAFSEADAARMCDRLWNELARRHRIRRDDRATWRMRHLHPWLFHAPAPNCTAEPRMVVAHNLHTPQARARFGATAHQS